MNTVIKPTIYEFFNWSSLVNQIAISFSLENDEKKLLSKSKVAKLIGALPFLAGCHESERTSLCHLSIYIIAMKGSKSAFNHNIEDDHYIMDRLSAINNFIDGDEKIIKRGMSLLSLVMLHGYKRDIKKDKKLKKYNPISSGKWDYIKLVNELSSVVKSIGCSNMDEYIIIEETVFTYWSYT